MIISNYCCRRMAHSITCSLRSLDHLHSGIALPDECPVVIGRMPELKIVDSSCSRNQLELRANHSKRYVLVKRLGINPSQIEGIDIERHKSSRLQPGQTLYVANMKFPHHVVFEDTDERETGTHSLMETTAKEKSSINGSCASSGLSSDRKRNFKDKSNNKHCKKANIINQATSKPTELDPNKDSEYNFKSPSVKLKTTSHISLTKSETANASFSNVKSSSKLNHWSQGLKSSMSDPELIVFQDDLVVVIKDKYPKAKHHWLVLPTASISTLSKLDSSDVDLLKHMLKKGEALAKEAEKGSSSNFRFGYHAVASMSQLHMHVISQDFESACLKTKKHWNSFTTDYFVDAQIIIDELEREGKVKNRKSFTGYLDHPLRCHLCEQPQKNMPTLKKHIASCNPR